MTQAEPREAGDRALIRERYSFAPGEPLRILGSVSADTGSLYWPPRLRCPRTGGEVKDVDLPTEGTLYAWTFVHVPWPGTDHPNDPENPDGYGIGMVDLDSDGPRVPAVLVGPRRTWEIGQRMRACELPFTTIDGAPKSILAFEVIES